MTASAGAWYRVGKVKVTKNSQSVLGIGTNWQNDLISIAIGDVFTLDAKTWYEVVSVSSDTGITLDRNFEGNTQNNANYAIIRNTSGTILTRIAGQVAVQFNQKQLFLDQLRTWLNSNNASEELTDSHGLKQSIKTPKQMVRDHAEKLAQLNEIHPYPWAMRKVEFEARRQQNLEKYEASGFVHFGKNHSSLNNINQGMYAYPDITNRLRLGRAGSAAIGESKTDYPVVNIAGVLTNIEYLSSDIPSYSVEIKFPPAEDGTRTYDSATGISVRHATPALAFAAETAANKVVTDRVDMWGFEPYLREISDSDPFVYANGLIQSRATSINGVATTDDNVRPIEYFAWYEGDTTSRGRGVNWQTATEAQRMAIASDPKNNIYFNDATGNFEQWCVRGRSFAGLGNGDWLNINSATLSRSYPDYIFAYGEKVSSRVSVQGNQDSPVQGDPFYTATSDNGYNSKHPHKGVYSVGHTNGGHGDGFGIGGNCYFLVCGTLNRLNQGAYHPSFNPFGSNRVRHLNGNSSVTFDNPSARKVQKLADCFDFYDSASNPSGIAAWIQHGSIANVTFNGRPDLRCHDAIYASGAGGVCRDTRYSANGLSMAELAEHDLKVKSGEYRGVEKLMLTKPLKVNIVFRGHKDPNNTIKIKNNVNNTYNFIDLIKNQDRAEIKMLSSYGGKYNQINLATDGDYIKLVDSSGAPLTNSFDLFGRLPTSSDASFEYFADIEILISEETGISIASEYTHTEVFGPPDKILLCDDLKHGWIGGYSPDIPDGSNKEFRFTRPIESFYKWGSTTDGGANWSIVEIAPSSFDAVKNSRTLSKGAGTIYIYHYKTKAKLTRPANVAAIHRGHAGIGNVYLTQNYLERDLCYSLTDNIIIRSSHARSESTVPLKDNGRLYGGTFYSTSPRTFDMPSTFPLPDNNSPALMALNYAVEQNGMAVINYAYAELKFDSAAGDWGCDGNVPMINGQSTMIDDNGNIVKVGTAQTESLGWIKRAS